MNIHLDEKYWSNRYKNNETGWDIGAASTPLVEYFKVLDNRDLMICIPGAGNAYEAEYLFVNGFKNIYILDISKEPLEAFKRRVPSFPDQQLLHMNFFDCNINFDLIIEQTFFCAIEPHLRPQYVDKMAQLLKPYGKLVGLLFNDPLNVNHPPFGGNIKEYQSLFEYNFDIEEMTPCFNSIPPRAGRELFIKMKVKFTD